MVKPNVQTKSPRATAQPAASRGTGRADGQSTRDAILAATFRRVVSDGYSNLNVREIAREADVTHALINYHFRNKQQLVLEVLDQANRRLLERQQRMYAQSEAVSAQWRQACEFYEEDLSSGFVKLMMELMAASFTDPVLRAEYLPRFLSWRRVVDGAVKEAIERHGLQFPVSPQAISTWIGCFWVGMEAEMALGITEPEGHHREALAAMLSLIRLMEDRPATKSTKSATSATSDRRKRTAV